MEKEVYERMLEEYKELDKKVLACRVFITKEEEFKEVDLINRDLLIAQLKAMETYLSILSIRLGINSAPQESKDE